MHQPIMPHQLMAPAFGRPLPKPSGIIAPPPAPIEMAELAYVRQLNANRAPEAVQFTEFLDKQGGYGLWKDFAKQYRKNTGFVRGWMGTGLLNVALGVNALRTWSAKGHYDRLRPYEVDGSIQTIGKAPKSGA